MELEGEKRKKEKSGGGWVFRYMCRRLSRFLSHTRWSRRECSRFIETIFRHLLCNPLFFQSNGAARRVYIPPSRRSSALFYMRLYARATASRIWEEDGRVLIVIARNIHYPKEPNATSNYYVGHNTVVVTKGVASGGRGEIITRERECITSPGKGWNEEFRLRVTVFRRCLLRYVTIVYCLGALLAYTASDTGIDVTLLCHACPTCIGVINLADPQL